MGMRNAVLNELIGVYKQGGRKIGLLKVEGRRG
jgi:hypothetical protein